MLELGDSCKVVVIRIVHNRCFLVEFLVHCFEFYVDRTIFQIAELVVEEFVEGSCDVIFGRISRAGANCEVDNTGYFMITNMTHFTCGSELRGLCYIGMLPKCVYIYTNVVWQ